MLQLACQTNRCRKLVGFANPEASQIEKSRPSLMFAIEHRIYKNEQRTLIRWPTQVHKESTEIGSWI
jgi:hypothetical protein